MVGGVGVGAAVVGGGAGVVGGGVGLLVVGAGAALLVVGAGAVGAAVVALGRADGFAGPTVAVGDAAFVGSPGVAGGPHVTVYAAGLDAATAGLVTTSTTCPDAGTHAGNVSGSAAFVPAEAKVAESGCVRSPLDIAQ
jgi:hypothetical protein